MKLAVTAMAVVAAGLLGCHTGGGAGVDAGTFDCNGKSCDPATQYCLEVQVAASGWNPSCQPLPVTCLLQSPSCDCVQASMAGGDCINSDGGIIVTRSIP